MYEPQSTRNFSVTCWLPGLPSLKMQAQNSADTYAKSSYELKHNQNRQNLFHGTEPSSSISNFMDVEVNEFLNLASKFTLTAISICSCQMRAYTCTSTGKAASRSSSRHEGGNRSCTRALEPLLNCTSNDRRVGNASSRNRTDLHENKTVLPKSLLRYNEAPIHLSF